MALTATDIATGNLLFERGLLTLEQLDEANRNAESWGVRIIDVLLSSNWIRPDVLYRTVASYYDLPFVDLTEQAPADDLFDDKDAENYARELIVPWRPDGEKLVFATANPGATLFEQARGMFGPNFDIVVTSKADIVACLQKRFRDTQSKQAVYDLAERTPEMSAQRVVTPFQGLFYYVLFTLLAVSFVIAPLATFVGLNLLMSVFYSGALIFRALLVWFGDGTTRQTRALEAEARLLREDELPVFSILVPMFREPEVLPILTNALRSLDYPRAKLDIKLVLEEGDTETIAAAEALELEAIFQIVRVPKSQPQTKPKACNYALKFCQGEFLVIYDAEDKPEPDQLRKVVAAFERSPDNTACIQCRLNYYNARENWLTRLFTLDYSLWFDLMLPGLEKLGIPIPLGGTSNHFRIDVLRALGAWDPFNVTEDADLGIRLTQNGYRVGVIDSTTYEEANCRMGNWIRQRSRWIKGYMQTFLVHTRRPLHLVRSAGFLGTLGFVFFVGGTMLSGLFNPIFWLIFVAWLLGAASGLDNAFPPVLLGIALFNLIVGNGLFIYLSIVATFRRGWLDLAPFGLTVVLYWLLMSVSAYKALWQLVANPFYWEKTTHGLSSHTATELAALKQARQEQAT